MEELWATSEKGYCILCDEPPTEASGPLVATRWGWMHNDCATSHDEAVGDEAHP